MRVYNKLIEESIALNTNIPGKQMSLQHMYGFAIQVNCTGTPNGTFKLQASTDPFATSPSPSHWTDITGSSVAAAGANFSYLWNVTDVMYNWVRVVYTDASGGASTAVAHIVLNGKGI